MAAGYSGTPLAKKLGLRPETRLRIANAPTGFAVPGAPAVVDDPPWDVVLWFTTSREALAADLAALLPVIARDGAVWVCWRKRTGRRPVAPDAPSEDAVRAAALPLGLVDTKVCAVDETWSGLRLVLRRHLR